MYNVYGRFKIYVKYKQFWENSIYVIKWAKKTLKKRVYSEIKELKTYNKFEKLVIDVFDIIILNEKIWSKQ